MQRKLEIIDFSKYSPVDIIKTFKYFKQQKNPAIVRKLKYNKITFKTEYEKYKKYADKLFELCKKYNINFQKYIKFCVNTYIIENVKELYNINYIIGYSSYLKKIDEYYNIYEGLMKSVDFMASECIKNNISVRRCFVNMVYNNTLGYEYICGNLSKYFIVSICNFKDVYKKFDMVNRGEFSIILPLADELRDNLFESYKFITGEDLKIIKLIENKINNTNK